MPSGDLGGKTGKGRLSPRLPLVSRTDAHDMRGLRKFGNRRKADGLIAVRGTLAYQARYEDLGRLRD